MKKRKICGVLAAAMVGLSLLAGCSSQAEVDEPCMYCSSSPSVAYQKASGETVYVCKECSSECMICGAPATKHYDTLLGVAFACDECYTDATGE